MSVEFNSGLQEFQSTYLYKVRRLFGSIGANKRRFNPRTYIRYDITYISCCCPSLGFNPRTYIRYDPRINGHIKELTSFNPRTYIRYDLSVLNGRAL